MNNQMGFSWGTVTKSTNNTFDNNPSTTKSLLAKDNQADQVKNSIISANGNNSNNNDDLNDGLQNNIATTVILNQSQINNNTMNSNKRKLETISFPTQSILNNLKISHLNNNSTNNNGNTRYSSNSNSIHKPQYKLHNNNNNNNNKSFNTNNISIKKKNYLNLIKSQDLPMDRSLQLMNKDQLIELIGNITNNEPFMQLIINNNVQNFLTNRINIDTYLADLIDKFNKIITNIPYNKNFDIPDNINGTINPNMNNYGSGEINNYYGTHSNNLSQINSPLSLNYTRINNLDDYSFIRLKPFILEFLNCLIDYLLFNIPPKFKNIIESLNFLDNVTILIINLPRFSLASNNYYYDKCLEQISMIWCTLTNYLINDSNNGFNSHSLNNFLINWSNKLEKYNLFTNNLLLKPLNLINSMIINNDYSTGNNSNSLYAEIINNKQ